MERAGGGACSRSDQARLLHSLAASTAMTLQEGLALKLRQL